MVVVLVVVGAFVVLVVVVGAFVIVVVVVVVVVVGPAVTLGMSPFESFAGHPFLSAPADGFGNWYLAGNVS